MLGELQVLSLTRFRECLGLYSTITLCAYKMNCVSLKLSVNVYQWSSWGMYLG